MNTLGRVAAILALSLSLAPSAILAEPSPQEVLVTALEANDCILTTGTLEQVLLTSGFNREALESATIELFNDGATIGVRKGVIYLQTGDICEGFEGPPLNEADPVVTAALRRQFEQSNCRLSFEELGNGLADQFNSEKIDAAAFALMNDGSLKLKNDYATLNTGEVCVGAADRPLSAIERLPELNRAVLAEFAAHDCTIAEADFPKIFHPTEMEIITAMSDAGTITKVENGDGYRLVFGPDCGRE